MEARLLKNSRVGGSGIDEKSLCKLKRE